jgi:hypothetical protein
MHKRNRPSLEIARAPPTPFRVPRDTSARRGFAGADIMTLGVRRVKPRGREGEHLAARWIQTATGCLTLDSASALAVAVWEPRSRRRYMDREYDLFEIFPDGSQIWRDSVTGHEKAIRRLRELVEVTDNEFRVMHTPTNTLIVSMKRAKP